MSENAHIFSEVLNLFFPKQCAACREILMAGEQVLCLKCCAALPRTNFHLLPQNPVCAKFRGRLSIRQACSFLYFTKDGRTQQLLHQFKYRGRKDVGQFLAGLFAGELLSAGWMRDIDVIVPLPIHVKKQRIRGYNQSAVMAVALSAASGIPVADKQALVKVSHTTSQTRKGRLERLRNVQNVFQLRNGKEWQGRQLLLVDDVLTTGATLEACALELFKAEPAGISVATLAIASDM